MQRIILNEYNIKVKKYEEERINQLFHVSVIFDVTSEEYHDVTTLLYKGTFTIQVPEKDITFIGTIKEYSTSITNLYEKEQVGEFRLRLAEVKSEEGSACY